jgi:hypothetical protein
LAVAGDAVLIAPVSSPIPCKQGFYRERDFWAFKSGSAVINPFARRHFFADSLLKLTGKKIQRTGIFIC